MMRKHLGKLQDFVLRGVQMKSSHLRSCALLTALMLALPPSFAQQAPPPAPVAGAAAATTSPTFSQQELDQLLAPIALYPDALLAQILMASTYPLEVVQAARWVKDNPKLTGGALEDALAKQAWDPAVKSLAAVPQVLQQMNDQLEWTQKLGDAFLAQQQAVMDTVQVLRAKAHVAGNLQTTEQQVVTTKVQETQTIYVVESAKPEVVYVPTYNPTVAYGSWWYPYPPYSMYPPSYVYPPGVGFATGVIVGAAIWGGVNWGWGNSDVDIDINRYNDFNRTNISNKNWNHNVEHRGGVAYRDQNVAQRYNRGDNPSAVKAREDYRGRAESGRQELNQMDRGELDRQVQDANRAQGRDGDRAQTRDADRAQTRDTDRSQARDTGSRDMAGDRAAAGQRQSSGTAQRPSSPSSTQSRDRSSSGFSGVNNSSSTRAASQRGGASRSQMSGGGGARAGGGGARGGRR